MLLLEPEHTPPEPNPERRQHSSHANAPDSKGGQNALAIDNTLGYLDNKPFSDFLKEYSDYSNCTLADLEDELLKAFLTSKKNQRFYYAQAEFYIRRTNVYKPLPIFVLHTEDIPEGLVKELTSLNEITKDKVITNVVRKIYQAVDADYFAINGIWAKVKWFMLEDTIQ